MLTADHGLYSLCVERQRLGPSNDDAMQRLTRLTRLLVCSTSLQRGDTRYVLATLVPVASVQTFSSISCYPFRVRLSSSNNTMGVTPLRVSSPNGCAASSRFPPAPDADHITNPASTYRHLSFLPVEDPKQLVGYFARVGVSTRSSSSSFCLLERSRLPRCHPRIETHSGLSGIPSKRHRFHLVVHPKLISRRRPCVASKVFDDSNSKYKAHRHSATK